jgi:hypothetical protein
MSDAMTIPPITDPLGRYWEQPDTSKILIDDEVALMDQRTHDDLAEYSASTPTGVYPGKAWKACRFGKSYLRWFGEPDGHPDGLPTYTRPIVIC